MSLNVEHEEVGAGLRMWRPFFCSLFGVPKRSFVFIFKKIVGTNTGTPKEFLNWSDYFNSNISPSMLIFNRLKL